MKEPYVRTKKMRKESEMQKTAGTFLFAFVLTALIDLAFVLLARYWLDGVSGPVFLRFVLLPLSAFLGAFFSLLFLRKMLPCMVSALTVHLIYFWIICGFRVSALLWNLLYFLSALMALAIVYIILTHKEK